MYKAVFENFEMHVVKHGNNTLIHKKITMELLLKQLKTFNNGKMIIPSDREQITLTFDHSNPKTY